MIGYLCKSLRIISLVWPTRLISLAMGEVLSFGFNLAVSFPIDSRGSKARILLLPSRITRWVSREICLHDTYWDRAPFLVRRGAEVARRADRGDAHKGFTQLRAARMRKTLLLLCGLYCVLARGR